MQKKLPGRKTADIVHQMDNLPSAPPLSFADILFAWHRTDEAGHLLLTIRDLAADIGVPEMAIYSWRARDSIPMRYWRRIVASAQKRGLSITMDDLDAADSRRWKR